MKNINPKIEFLLREGFSILTLENFNDRQINLLYEKTKKEFKEQAGARPRLARHDERIRARPALRCVQRSGLAPARTSGTGWRAFEVFKLMSSPARSSASLRSAQRLRTSGDIGNRLARVCGWLDERSSPARVSVTPALRAAASPLRGL